MTEEADRKRWEELVGRPFVPANIGGINAAHITAEYRVATALEYIAAQLDQINAKLKVLAEDKSSAA